MQVIKAMMRFHGKCRNEGKNRKPFLKARFQIMPNSVRQQKTKIQYRKPELFLNITVCNISDSLVLGFSLLHSDLGQIPGIIAECCGEAKPKRIERLPE